MKKKHIILIIIITMLLILGIIIFLSLNNENQSDENTLYSTEFGNIKLKVERYDYSLGQNQLVGVEKSINNGKTYDKLTKELITVSMEPKFVFLSENLGFAISNPKLTKNNNYLGIKVTQDGGISFIDSKVNYINPEVENLAIEDVPYLENSILKLPCSIYQVKEDKTGYETKTIIFISVDNGLTWNLE